MLKLIGNVIGFGVGLAAMFGIMFGVLVLPWVHLTEWLWKVGFSDVIGFLIGSGVVLTLFALILSFLVTFDRDDYKIEKPNLNGRLTIGQVLFNLCVTTPIVIYLCSVF